MTYQSAFWALLLCGAMLCAAPARAQETPAGAPETAAEAPATEATPETGPETGTAADPASDPESDDDVLTEKPEEPVEMIDKKVVRIRILDKITANTRNFNLDVGQTVSYGDLRINPKACRKAPPTAEPEAAAFLEVWQFLPKKQETEWVFSGWMFASSPGLSAMDHPIYDVWVIDCLDSKKETEAAAPKPDQPDKPVEDGEPSEAFPDLGD